MGNLHATALAELQKVTPRAYSVLEVTFPSGAFRATGVAGEKAGGVNVSGVGHYRPVIKAWSDIDYRLAGVRCSLEPVECSVVIEDVEKTFVTIREERGDDALFGSAATIRRALGGGVAQANWPDEFIGIYDRSEPAGARKWRLHFRCDDRALDRALALLTLTPQQFPFASSPTLGGVLPVAYGYHDSRDGTVPGAVGALPTLYLGSYSGSDYRYLVAAPMFHIERVFKDGVLVSSANWSRLNIQLAGLAYTVIKFTADQLTAKITCDGVGLSEAPLDGRNAHPYLNPVDILRHALANLVFNSWYEKRSTGVATWYGDADAPIDVASWDAAEAWGELQRWRHSLYLADKGLRAGDLLQQVCQTHALKPYWRPNGKIGLAHLDPFVGISIYPGDTGRLRALHGADDDWQAQAAGRDRLDGVRRTYWSLPAQSGDRAVLTVYAPYKTGRSIEDQALLGEGRRLWDRSTLTPASVTSVWTARQPAQGNLTDQSALSTWDDVSGGTVYSLTASGTPRPILVLGELNARPVVRFDGVDDLMTTAEAMSTFVSVGAGTIFVLFRAKTIPANEANPLHNAALVFSTAKMGLTLRNNASVYTIEATIDDGTQRTITKTISLNTWYLARWSWDGSIQRLNVFPAESSPFADVSGSAGAIASLTGGLAVGRGGAGGAALRYFDGDIAEIHMFNSADLFKQGAHNAPSGGIAFYGGGAEYEIFRSLTDEYAL